MTAIIVLFNLKPDADRDAYEAWARQTDLPIVNNLGSVEKFEILKTQGLLGGGDSPYQYIEVLRLHDFDGLVKELATDTMQRVAAEFHSFADQPLFILTADL